jgi:hypothetical protein
VARASATPAPPADTTRAAATGHEPILDAVTRDAVAVALAADVRPAVSVTNVIAKTNVDAKTNAATTIAAVTNVDANTNTAGANVDANTNAAAATTGGGTVKKSRKFVPPVHPSTPIQIHEVKDGEDDDDDASDSDESDDGVLGDSRDDDDDDQANAGSIPSAKDVLAWRKSMKKTFEAANAELSQVKEGKYAEDAAKLEGVSMHNIDHATDAFNAAKEIINYVYPEVKHLEPLAYIGLPDRKPLCRYHGTPYGVYIQLIKKFSQVFSPFVEQLTEQRVAGGSLVANLMFALILMSKTNPALYSVRHTALQTHHARVSASCACVLCIKY